MYGFFPVIEMVLVILLIAAIILIMFRKSIRKVECSFIKLMDEADKSIECFKEEQELQHSYERMKLVNEYIANKDRIMSQKQYDEFIELFNKVNKRTAADFFK